MRLSKQGNFWAIVISLIGGLGSGAGAAIYTDAKTTIGAYFPEKPTRLYVMELQGVCIANQPPDFSKVSIYTHSLAVSKVGSIWSGTITEDGKLDPKYNVTGFKNGNFLSLSWVSAKGNAGVGSYYLHRISGGNEEYYEGYAVGNDCFGGTERTVRCPVVLTTNTDLDAIKQKTIWQQPCKPE